MLAVVAGAGDFEAYAHGGYVAGAAWVHFDGVERVAGFCGSDLGGVHGVVAELLFFELMFRVAELAVGGDACGVELDLHFHIRGGDAEGSGELPGELCGGGFGGVDEAVAAIAVARELFEEVVVIAFPADAEAVECDALFAVALHFFFQRGGAHVAEICCAVGHQDDAVHAADLVVLEGGGVAEVHRCAEVGAALRGDLADARGELAGFVAGDAIGPEPWCAGESDDAQFVLRLELLGEDGERFLQNADAVGALHRAGVVEQQDDVQRASGLAASGGSLYREAEEVAVLGEGIARPLGGECERRTGRGFGVAVVEGVDELFAAHAGYVGHRALF